MKSALSLFTFIVTTLGFYVQNDAPKIYVEYNVLKGSINTSEYLIADSKYAVYTTDFLEITNDESIEKQNDNQYSISQAEIKINALTYYAERDSSNLYFVSEPKNKQNTIVAIDSLPDFSWNLDIDEFKMLGNFKCYKATTTFRSSKIIAFYTPEIQIGFGPFKFKGLPGLIMEVYNDDQGLKYHWKASKVIIPFKKEVDLEFSSESHKSSIVSYRSIVEKFDNKLKQMDQKMKTRVARGEPLP